MKGRTLFLTLLAAFSASLMALSLLLPADNPSKSSESRTGPLLAAALSLPAKQGDDLEINSLLDAGKRSGLVSRATVVNSGKRIIADTEAEAVGTFFVRPSVAKAGESYDIPGVPGCKMMFYASSSKLEQYSLARILGFLALASSLLYAFISLTLPAGKLTTIPATQGAAERDAAFIGKILVRSGGSEKYVVLNSAGVIIGSGPSEQQGINGKKLFESELKNRILRSAENPENVFDVAGMKFIFY